MSLSINMSPTFQVLAANGVRIPVLLLSLYASFYACARLIRNRYPYKTEHRAHVKVADIIDWVLCTCSAEYHDSRQYDDSLLKVRRNISGDVRETTQSPRKSAIFRSLKIGEGPGEGVG